jgi:hypothetical protein
VTRTAEQSIVLEPAFAAAVRDGDDVIGFPTGTKGAPGAPRDPIASGRLRSCPLTMGFHHVEAAELAGALIALLDLLTDVPRAAPDLPLVHARVTAERAARRLHGTTTPAADRLAGVIAIGPPPLISGYNARATGAHEVEYRRVWRAALGAAAAESTEITGRALTRRHGDAEARTFHRRRTLLMVDIPRVRRPRTQTE